MDKISIFKLIKLRTHHSYAELSQEELDRTTFFKESVDVLENYSKFIEDVLGGKNSVLKEFELNQRNEDGDFGKSAYQYFDQLKTLPIFIPRLGYKLGQDILPSGLFEFLVKIKGSESSYFLDKSSKQNFSPRQIRKLINWIKGSTGSISWNRVAGNKIFINEFNEICNYFDKIIANHQNIKVLCLDIRLKNNHTDNYENFDEDFRRINWGYADKIHHYLNDFPDFSHGFFKYENDHQHGLNLHCILFFEGKGKLSTKAKIEQLKEKIIRDKFETGVEISDWLAESKKLTKLDFSKISSHQQELIQQFKTWILGYFVYIDRIIKLDYKDSKNESLPINGIFWKQDRSRQLDSNEAYSKHIEFWQKLIEGKNPQKIWQYQNLAKDAIERIKVTELVYKEVEKSDTKFADLAEVGIRLEIFIENLLVSNGGLFDFPRQWDELNPLTKDELTYSITRSCQQYFSLLDEQEKIKRLFDYSSDGMTSLFLTSTAIHIRSFFSKIQDGNKFNLGLQKIDELNIKSLALKKRYQVQTFQDGRLQIRTNQVSQNFNKVEANIVQHKICARRYATAIDYINHLFKQDLVICRVQFRLKKHRSGLPQEEFSKLFTSFVRFAKRSKPLSMGVGYLGSWNIGYENRIFADVLFFFPRTKINQLDKVGESIVEYWDRFLYNHIQNKINREPQDIINSSKSIEIFLSQPEFNSNYVVIGATDKKKQRLFKNTIIKYLCYKEIFQPRPNKVIKKVLMKGTVTKPKNDSIPVSDEETNFSLALYSKFVKPAKISSSNLVSDE
ncbi:hypothetical protein SB581_04700 [Acinetobacter baumannii]|nr:hypothetical protein SB581_04700 [Acinetobacter baumannii]